LQSTENIEQVFKVNLMSAVYGIKNIVPIMLNQNDECWIVNTSAGAGFLTGAGMSPYKASKHAITAITETLAADLKNINSNIHVALLIPHWVNTNIVENIKTDDKTIIQKHAENLKINGMDSDVVAEKLFEALEKKQFYIFTHPEEHLPRIKKRMEEILN